MSVPCRVAELSLRDRVRSLNIQMELWVEPLLPRVERSQLRLSGLLIRMNIISVLCHPFPSGSKLCSPMFIFIAGMAIKYYVLRFIILFIIMALLIVWRKQTQCTRFPQENTSPPVLKNSWGKLSGFQTPQSSGQAVVEEGNHLWVLWPDTDIKELAALMADSCIMSCLLCLSQKAALDYTAITIVTNRPVSSVPVWEEIPLWGHTNHGANIASSFRQCVRS